MFFWITLIFESESKGVHSYQSYSWFLSHIHIYTYICLNFEEVKQFDVQLLHSYTNVQLLLVRVNFLVSSNQTRKSWPPQIFPLQHQLLWKFHSWLFLFHIIYYSKCHKSFFHSPAQVAQNTFIRHQEIGSYRADYPSPRGNWIKHRPLVFPCSYLFCLA